MKYVYGALAGLVWGALAALLNGYISKRAMQKEKASAMMGANLVRTAVDVAALAAVLLLRNVLPFSFEAALVGTALSLSMLTIVIAFQLSRPDKPDK